MRNRALLTGDNREKIEGEEELPASTNSHLKKRLSEVLERDIEILAQHRKDLLKLALETVIRTSTRCSSDVLDEVLQDTAWTQERSSDSRVKRLEERVEELEEQLEVERDQ